MTAITSLEPRSGLASSESLSDLFHRLARLSDWTSLRMGDELRLDIRESDKAYLVKAELPGADKQDVRVRVDGSSLWIATEAHPEKKELRGHDGERVLLRETHQGGWSRSVNLPQDVDDKAAEAHFENGLLTLTLPKRTPNNGKAIPIK